MQVSSSKSALYQGRVRHRRLGPIRHEFRYEMLYFYLDLSEIDQIFRLPLLCSKSGPSVLAFRRKDYLGDPAVSLDESVRKIVEERVGKRPTGPIRVLTQLSFLGFCFNPISLYYCFEDVGGQQTVRFIVAEVTNTPWGERHAYVVERKPEGTGGLTNLMDFEVPKALHVSPFMPMQMTYRWRLTPPAHRLGVHMENFHEGQSEPAFDATMTLARKPLHALSMLSALVHFPLLTFKAFIAIYWQALRLALKGVRFQPHPDSRVSKRRSFGDWATGLAISYMEKGLIPDTIVRAGIRRLCSVRLVELQDSIGVDEVKSEKQYALKLRQSPLAVSTSDANRQHYEVPSDFFELTLGDRRKYSCAYWGSGVSNLNAAENAALDISIDRAELKDGMSVLELGCGWGSLTLAMAARFPNATITAVSNSKTQKSYIDSKAREFGLRNVQVLTRDVSKVDDFVSEFGAFDRVVSVEMFEHFRNYEQLLKRISRCLNPDGKVFVHIFTHRKYSYFFDVDGEDNWMGRYFFTGGQMPGKDLFKQFRDDLLIEKQWVWDGSHYAKTSDAWLGNLDANREKALKLMEVTYGKSDAKVWLQRWRIFFMACSELFGYSSGSEWFVTHYLFGKVQSS